MSIVLSNQLFATIHSGNQPFLIGNVGHVFKFTGDIATTIGVTSTTNLPIVISGANQITLQGGNWLDYGILEGNSIDLDAVNVGTDIDVTVTVTNINGNVLTHNGNLSAFLSQIYPSTDNGQLIVKNNTHTDVEQLDVFFNLIPNDANGGIQSLIDGEVNKIRFSGVDAMVATDTVTGVVLGNKSGGAILDAELTKVGANDYQIEINFINWLDYVENDPNVTPDYYVANSSIKPFFQFEGQVQSSNPNSVIRSNSSTLLGNVGFIGENHNQGLNPFIPFFVEFKNSLGQVINEIDHTGVTDVDLRIGRIGATTINANKFITKIQHLPTNDVYKNNANSYQQNTYQSLLIRDTSYTKTAYGVGGAQLVISDEDVTSGTITINAQTAQIITIKFKVTPNTAFTNYFNSLPTNERVYRILTTLQSTGLTDDTTVINHLGNYEKSPVIGGLSPEVVELNFFNHSQQGTTGGLLSFDAMTEDDIFAKGILRMDKGFDYDNIKVCVRVVKQSDGSFFDLWMRNIPMNNYPLNADNVRLVQLEEQLNYLLPNPNRNTFKLEIGTIASTTYDLNLTHTVLMNWRYWLAQSNALADFLDVTLPQNGLNQEWVRYAVAGFDFVYRIEIERDGAVFFKDVFFTNVDYDSTDVTTTIEFKDTLGNALPSVVDGVDCVVVATHTALEAWPVDDTWGWIAYRPFESEQRKLISSEWEHTNNNLPLRPITGEDRAELTFPSANVAVLKALVKGSEIGQNYTFVSRIQSPRVEGCSSLIDVLFASLALSTETQSGKLALLTTYLNDGLNIGAKPTTICCPSCESEEIYFFGSSTIKATLDAGYTAGGCCEDVFVPDAC
jgi:hypothetical protein